MAEDDADEEEEEEEEEEQPIRVPSDRKLPQQPPLSPGNYFRDGRTKIGTTLLYYYITTLLYYKDVWAVLMAGVQTS